MKVALLGPEGTYTHQAGEKYFEQLEPVFCSSIREIFEADTEKAVIPFENSLGGGVTESIDLLRELEIEITGEVKIPIRHCLTSKQGIEEIEKVKSHPQALSQCRDLIEEHGWEEVESSSTAKAARELDEGEAAICSELAAEMNDLGILRRSVQDTDSNITRFLVLDGEGEEGDKTSMILEPGEDRPGILHSMLGCFSGHGINLSYIQSRPTKEEMGEYFFYVEADSSRQEESFRKAVKCLETYSEVKVLGSYRGDPI